MVSEKSANPPGAVPAAVRSSRRGGFWVIQIMGHALMLVLWWRGEPWLALMTMLATHAVFWWANLYPHSRWFGPVIAQLATQDRAVWLTFDDGPSADTPALLDLLDRHGARATFFLVATKVERQPELAREILRRGHQIGNHSYDHPSAWFWLPHPGRTRRQIQTAQQRLQAITGQSPRWFRSVAGHTNLFVEPVLRPLGLQRVSWSGRGFDSVDADDDRVLRRLLRGVGPGAILLLHEDLAPGRCPRLLEKLLAALALDGYRLVLADESSFEPMTESLTSERVT